MADVTGPISTLPGHVHSRPPGAKCDDHPERDAVRRVQGETDSMGSEMLDVCQECFDKIQAYEASPEACTGTCDYCREQATDLRVTRDYEEGMCGPVYNVCGACRKRVKERAATEYEESDHNDY